MRFNQVITLISVTITADSVGNQIETPTERDVFANEFTIGSEEFYGAAQTGLKPVKKFEVYSFEYQSEGRFKHNGIIYRIIRVETKGEKTRLTGEKAAADEGTPFAAYLASLTVGVLPLVPVFSPAIVAYTVATTNATNIITAIAQDPTATIVVKLNNVVMTNGAAATWIAGANTVTVAVTKDADTLTYTLAVTKT